MDELEVVWFRNKSCRFCYYGWDLLPTYVTSWSWWYWTTWMIAYLKMLLWYDNLSWKDCIDAAKNLKALLLLCWCYNHWMTLEDTTTLFYLSVVQGSIQISQKEAEHCLFLTENQIWLKFRRWLGKRGFPETQSRIHASSCTENRICLIADKFLFGVSFL